MLVKRPQLVSRVGLSWSWFSFKGFASNLRLYSCHFDITYVYRNCRITNPSFWKPKRQVGAPATMAAAQQSIQLCLSYLVPLCLCDVTSLDSMAKRFAVSIPHECRGWMHQSQQLSSLVVYWTPRIHYCNVSCAKDDFQFQIGNRICYQHCL